MGLNDAFDKLQGTADADPEQVKEARRRRDLFRNAFKKEADVVEVVPSGSLARSTQREPINDVDVIIVFKASEHPDSQRNSLIFRGEPWQRRNLRPPRVNRIDPGSFPSRARSGSVVRRWV